MPSLNVIRNRYPNVSEFTKTAISMSIGFDVEGLQIKDGGKYTKEELAQGLRYLLTQNENLKSYMETEIRSDEDAYYDPFYVPNGTIWLFPPVVNHSHSCSSSSFCPSGGSNHDADVVIACVALTAATCGFCLCSCVNTTETLKNKNESSTVKAGKILSSLAAALVPGILLWVLLRDKPEEGYGTSNDATEFIADFTFHYLLPFAVSMAMYALSSYIAKKIPINQKPSADLLTELGVIKQLLENNYVREGDDPAACKAFIKEVVRYYIGEISRTNDLEVIDERTPLVPPQPLAIGQSSVSSVPGTMFYQQSNGSVELEKNCKQESKFDLSPK